MFRLPRSSVTWHVVPSPSKAVQPRSLARLNLHCLKWFPTSGKGRRPPPVTSCARALRFLGWWSAVRAFLAVWAAAAHRMLCCINVTERVLSVCCCAAACLAVSMHAECNSSACSSAVNALSKGSVWHCIRWLHWWCAAGQLCFFWLQPCYAAQVQVAASAGGFCICSFGGFCICSFGSWRRCRHRFDLTGLQGHSAVSSSTLHFVLKWADFWCAVCC